MDDVKKYLDKKFLYPIFAGFLLFILVKIFFIDVVLVKSPAMQPVLNQGEWVFVKKMFKPQRNDLVFLSLPLTEKDLSQEKMKVFKRIVGMPGDTVAVIYSKVYVNGRMLTENDSFLHNYVAKVKKQVDTLVFDSVSIKDKYLIDDSCVYLLILDARQHNELLGKKQTYSLLSSAEDSALYDETIFPNDPKTRWNKDFFGPLYIPKKGDELKLDTSNIRLYERLITSFEDNALEIEKGKIYINEKEVHSYTVKNNYYFVTGDNFDNSIDSRHWGFIPENKMKGRLLLRR